MTSSGKSIRPMNARMPQRLLNDNRCNLAAYTPAGSVRWEGSCIKRLAAHPTIGRVGDQQNPWESGLQSGPVPSPNRSLAFYECNEDG